MRKLFENNFAMIIATVKILFDFEDVWKSSAAFDATVKRLQAYLETITNIRKTIETKTTGITAQKKEVKASLIALLVEFSSALIVFFSQNEDTVMLHKVTYTKSIFLKMREGKLVTVANELVKIASDNLAALADYKIDKEKIENIRSQTTLLSELSATPRLSIIKIKTAHTDLSSVFKASIKLLSNELDLLMVAYAKTHPDFYNQYTNARITVQYGTRHDKDNEEEINEVKPIE
jgi:hypothetical protein